MSDDTIHIVLTCDDKYAQHAAVTIVSVVKNTKRKVHFYVFDCGILPENLERLKRLDVGSNVLEVVQVQKIEAFENYKYRQCYSPAIMYRLATAEILPHLDKVLYLDCDVVAVRDVGELWDIDLGDKLLAGKDALEFYDDRITDLECGCRYNKIYFHTAVLLMNLKKMREWHFFEKVIETVKRAPCFSCPDQGILYLLLDNCHWKVLSRSYFTLLMFNYDTVYPSVCYHYSFRPWIFPEILMRFLPGMFWNIMRKYYKYLSCTPWADCKNKYVTFKGVQKYLRRWVSHRSWFSDGRMAPFKSIIEEIKRA